MGLWINRGWVAAVSPATATPTLPPTPAGTITVVARMRYTQSPRRFDPSDLPSGQIDLVDVPGISRDLGYPVYDAYGEAITETPAPASAPTPIPPPDVSDGPHLSYAIPWVTFALIAIGGAVIIIRKEAEERALARAEERGEVVATGDTGDTGEGDGTDGGDAGRDAAADAAADADGARVEGRS